MQAKNREIEELMETIDRLLEDDELCCAIIHMNDTYQIEERRSDTLELPGMARVASVISQIRERIGSDRTLVVHSGDFLSPSYLSNRCETHGRPMVELLDLIGVDYLTLGNHEFDHDERGSAIVLESVLNDVDPKFKILSANLILPKSFPSIEAIAYWPTEAPNVALFGLAGEETAEVASEHGFRALPWEECARKTIAILRSRPEIGYVAVLSHMGRDEDKALQELLWSEWRDHGHAHIFGGHDHHIDRFERDPFCTLSKNLSNCGTVSVSIVTRTIIGAPASTWGLPPYQVSSRAQELEEFRNQMLSSNADHAELVLSTLKQKRFDRDVRTEQWLERSARRMAADRPQGWAARRAEIYAQEIDRASAYYRDAAKRRRSPDNQDAFVRHLKHTAMTEGSWLAESLGSVAKDAFEMARDYAFESAWTGRHYSKADGGPEQLFWTVPASAFETVEPLEWVEEKTAEWMELQRQRIENEMGEPGTSLIVDLREPGSIDLDARDKSIRCTSTDFGNMVADAVEIGTGVGAALIHSGSFRIDQRLGPRVSVKDLFECFIYDSKEAVLISEFSPREIAAMLGHARRKFGSGSFLQVSNGAINMQDDAPIRTAIAAYLLRSDSDQDGYQALLAEMRGLSRSDMYDQCFAHCETHSLIVLCRDNLGKVKYDATIRLRATQSLSPSDAWMARFIEASDAYADFCNKLDLSFSKQTEILAVPYFCADEILEWGEEFLNVITNVYHCVDELFVPDFDHLELPSQRVSFFADALHRHERRFESGRDYYSYLTKAFEYIMQDRLRQIRERGDGGQM